MEVQILSWAQIENNRSDRMSERLFSYPREDLKDGANVSSAAEVASRGRGSF